MLSLVTFLLFAWGMLYLVAHILRILPPRHRPSSWMVTLDTRFAHAWGSRLRPLKLKTDPRAKWLLPGLWPINLATAEKAACFGSRTLRLPKIPPLFSLKSTASIAPRRTLMLKELWGKSFPHSSWEWRAAQEIVPALHTFRKEFLKVLRCRNLSATECASEAILFRNTYRARNTTTYRAVSLGVGQLSLEKQEEYEH
jgi:hypothetical protein